MSKASPSPAGAVTLGLGPNRHQFWLLVAVNACVGGVVGLERTVLPLLGEAEFGLASQAAVLSFIASFGLAKAVTNLVAGAAADRFGRKRILLIGWVLAIPVPAILILAPTWTWVVGANLLLGISQGLTWSTTVVMKIDLVGPARRGLALGLNEFSGYLAVGLAAFASGLIAEQVGLRPQPFYLGIVIVAVGLGLSAVWVRDTMAHVDLESGSRRERQQEAPASGWSIFATASWRDRSLLSCSQAGLINNLNDGVAWGLLPLVFAAGGLGVGRIGLLAAVYPVTWGVLQLGTGALSDRWGRKPLIVSGMLLQGVALWLVARASAFEGWLAAMALLGAGTAMVYPTLLAAVSDRAAPARRATTLGVYRFWRDLGYVFGALGVGVLADRLGPMPTLMVVAALTAASGIFAGLVMVESPVRR